MSLIWSVLVEKISFKLKKHFFSRRNIVEICTDLRKHSQYSDNGHVMAKQECIVLNRLFMERVDNL